MSRSRWALLSFRRKEGSWERCRLLRIRFFSLIWARISGGRGVLLCETGTEVLERSIFAWISSVNAVRASSISAVVFGVLHL